MSYTYTWRRRTITRRNLHNIRTNWKKLWTLRSRECIASRWTRPKDSHPTDYIINTYNHAIKTKRARVKSVTWWTESLILRKRKISWKISEEVKCLKKVKNSHIWISNEHTKRRSRESSKITLSTLLLKANPRLQTVPQKNCVGSYNRHIEKLVRRWSRSIWKKYARGLLDFLIPLISWSTTVA